MHRHSFITRMPDEPGALHRAASIARRYGGNINRLHYDRRIDPATVFFEITAEEEAYHRILEELDAIGYLQTSLRPSGFLRFAIHLPHRSGALDRFLTHITSAHANIAFLDFDDSGKHPERLVVSLSVEDSQRADDLLNALKSRYLMEILEYDTTGKRLDDTVFYLWFAQELRGLVGEAEDSFLLRLLQDINHIVQELMNLEKDPKVVFQSVLSTGKTLQATTGTGFYADVQQISISPHSTLYCFQLPGGGNVYLFSSPDEMVMVDTGYGIYHRDVNRMLQHFGLGDTTLLRRIIITHGDADHAGAAGYYPACAWMHPATRNVIEQANRAYGSHVETSILEAVYTKLINTFSAFSIPRSIQLFGEPTGRLRGIFPVLGEIQIGEIRFEVLEGLGGHLEGQIYLFAPSHGLLFTADTVINFESLTPERREYNSLAVNLVTSVNVDSTIASRERKALLALVRETELESRGSRCFVCGGHGAVSILEQDHLVPWEPIEHYPTGTVLEEPGPCDTTKS
jgi:glyoxylase-like metal-dependent hydrolase (beta-lactamase superfamily II)